MRKFLDAGFELEKAVFGSGRGLREEGREKGIMGEVEIGFDILSGGLRDV